MNSIMNKLGFKNLLKSDYTIKANQFLIGLFDDIKNNGPPKLGLNLLMGSTSKEKLSNILKGLEEDQLRFQNGIYRKLNN